MKSELEITIANAVHELYGTEAVVELTRPEEKFGDFSTNVALKIAKDLQKSPRDIASELETKLAEVLKDSIRDISIAGLGFINVSISDQSLIDSLSVGINQSLSGKTVVAEYSDPNPFKVLHAGHLYTTIVGDSISRLLEQAGATVHRLNYGGDVGLHVGKTMWAIFNELGENGAEKLDLVPEDERLSWLSTRYIEGNTAYDEDEAAKAKIVQLNKQVYQIHDEDDTESTAAKIYWKCREWSYEGFYKLYDQLQVTQFERYIPESESTPKGLEIVKDGLQNGVFKESDGAVIFEGEPFGLHTRVFINSEGLPTYEAKDLGLAALKWQDYKFDVGFIITGNDIVEYMKVVLKALENFYPEVVERSRHLTHGNVKLPGGVKMSSRKGNILSANDILIQTQLALEESGRDVNDQTLLGAVKYEFLKSRMGGDIIYDPAVSVALEGNSGPYLQYAHARARSIIKKSADDIVPLSGVLQEGERSLVRKISEYPEVVDKAVHDLMPHHIATYLYELAQVFNRFYEKNRVIGDERQTVRLALVNKYADTLKAGLGLLGITAPDRM